MFLENFTQESSEFKEIDWVQSQIKAELNALQKETFHTKERDKVSYDMITVKAYLESVKNKSREKLTSQNSSAFMQAVQIALESGKLGKTYDVGKIDGFFGGSTKKAVEAFQADNDLKADGAPGSATIKKILEKLWTPDTSKAPEIAMEAKSSLLVDQAIKNYPFVPGVMKRGNLYIPLTKKLQGKEVVLAYDSLKAAQQALAQRNQFEAERAKDSDGSHITFLTDEFAEELSKHQGDWLYLNGLTSLSDKQAESLSNHKGERLWLDGLTSLSDKQAESLSNYKGGRLSLDGLTNLSDKQAESLSNYKGERLWLDGLTSLSDKQAESLSNYKGERLYLDGLTNLSDKQAESLSNHQGDWLYLNGLTSLSDKQAESLSNYKGERLYLDGLTSLSDKQAESLSNYKGGRLSLDGLTNLSDKQAESLSNHKGDWLYLDGLTSLTNNQAESLAKYQGNHLSFAGLTSLTDSQAKSLAKYQGDFEFMNDTLKAKVEAYRKK